MKRFSGFVGIFLSMARSAVWLSAMAGLLIGLAPSPGWALRELQKLVEQEVEPSNLTGVDRGIHGALYFSGGTTNNQEPWISEGQPGPGNRQLRDIITAAGKSSYPSGFTHVPEIVPGGWVCFTAEEADGNRRLFVHELSTGEVKRVDQLVAANPVDPKYLTRVITRAYNGGWPDKDGLLFNTDGGLGSISRLQTVGVAIGYTFNDFYPGASVSDPRDFGVGVQSYQREGIQEWAQSLFFSADNGSSGREYYRWDYHSGDVTHKDLRPGSEGSNPTGFTKFGNRTLFSANDGTHGKELWIDNGEGSTTMLRDIVPGSQGSSPGKFCVVGPIAYFTAITDEHGGELWKTDGTQAGTVLVKDIFPGTSGSGIDHLTAYGSPGGQIVVFSAQSSASSGYELWKSNGSAAGTVQIKDIRPGSASSLPRDIAVLENRCYFSADDGVVGRELWVTDGTSAETKLIYDLARGPESGNPRQLTPAYGTSNRNTLFFTSGKSLYGLASNGTPPPPPPTSVHVDSANSDYESIKVAWSFGSSQVDGFNIYCDPDDGAIPSTRRQTAPGDYRSYYVSGLDSNTLYALTVIARSDEGGESLLPTPHFITHWTLAEPPTEGVNIASAPFRGPMSWGGAEPVVVSNPQGFGTDERVSAFQWVWSTSPHHSFSGSEDRWDSGDLSLPVTGPGDYYLHLRSVNGGNQPTEYPKLAYGPFRVDLDPPAAPSTPAGVQCSGNSVRFDWSATDNENGSGVSGYDVQIGSTPGGSDIYDGPTGTEPFKTLTVSPGQTCYARVRAEDRAGNVGPWSGNSDPVTVTGQVGSLTASISPAMAQIAGAQWRRHGTSTWRNSSVVETGVPVGRQVVEFKDLNNWMEPLPQEVTVQEGVQATVSGTYTDSGKLRVTITPEAAVTAGAQWRYWHIQGYPSDWIDSGERVELSSGLSGRAYVIEFKPVPGWGTPVDAGATITKGSSVEVGHPDGHYGQAQGSLSVEITPEEPVTAGARWRRVGTTDWLVSGTTETGVYAGQVVVEFKPVTGWTAPADRGILVLANETVVIHGAHSVYQPNTGSVIVTIAPPEAVEAGAGWRSTGETQWRSSDVTETFVPVGLGSVEFRPLPGWTRPNSQLIMVEKDQTSSVTATYERSTAVPSSHWQLY